MNTKIIIPVVLALIIGAGAGFFGGTKYEQSKTLSRFANGNRQFVGRNGNVGNGQVGQNGGNYRPVNGEILSVDDNGITVKMQDGSQRIVIINDQTAINKTSEATKSDLTVGESVAVFGTQNSDGSVTAQNVQINPNFVQNPNQSGQPSPTQ